jgi:pyrimidine-nucleoside phosphorylase
MGSRNLSSLWDSLQRPVNENRSLFPIAVEGFAMRAVDIIRKKRDGEVLDTAEIESFVRGATAPEGDPKRWPDYQVSALLMAIVLRGMTPDETATLTLAMIHSGEKLDLSDLPGPKIDKHSTGGVGDKTSLILAPLAAACGVVVPMMPGRGLGHTGGTLDKLESIPGFRFNLSLDEFRAALRKVGCAMIGQTAELAPADRVLYALRDVTATVESIPLISASIMSKKIAEGIDGLVLDVKCGRGAFMTTRDDARALADSLVAIGRANGVRTEAILTAMDRPLGRAIGNSLEVIEAIWTLEGNGPKDLETLSVHLAARMVHLGGLAANLTEAEGNVREALASGRGLEKFREIIVEQGGDPRAIDDHHLFPTAPHCYKIYAPRGGYVSDIDALSIGQAVMRLGAGRSRTDEQIDLSAGALLLAQVGEKVHAGELLAELYYSDPDRLPGALALLGDVITFSAEKPTVELILETPEG